MYTKNQLNYIFHMISDENNLVFSLTSQLILDYLQIDKSRKFINPLKNEFYSIFNKDEITVICRQKQGKLGNQVRNSKKIVYSDASKLKMKKSKKEFWNSIKGTNRELELKSISSNLMSNICTNKLNQTDEIKKKRVRTRKENNVEWHTTETKAKISVNQLGKYVTDETRLKQSIAATDKPKLNRRGDLNPCKRIEVRTKISDSITYLHRIGKYPLKIKSKGHNEIEKIILYLGYEVLSEFRLGRYSYDLYIPKLNKIIEFHGTYWHLDPKIYNEGFYDKSKKRTSIEQWSRDDIKKSHAISNGYNFNVIWQREWEILNEKQRIEKIKKILC